MTAAPQISPPKKSPKVQKREVEINEILVETTILAPFCGTDREKSGFLDLTKSTSNQNNDDHGTRDGRQQHNKGPKWRQQQRKTQTTKHEDILEMFTVARMRKDDSTATPDNQTSEVVVMVDEASVNFLNPPLIFGALDISKFDFGVFSLANQFQTMINVIGEDSEGAYIFFQALWRKESTGT